MAVTVLVSATLRSFTNRNAKFELEGETVWDILTALTEEYPEIQKVLFDDDNRLRDFIGVYVNEKNIQMPEGLKTTVRAGDDILLLPVIAGGAYTESLIPEESRKAVKLDDQEIDRYGNHLLLREIGVKGQKKIKAAKVLIAGAGGLASPIALYLGAAGVGTIGILDADEVSLTHLQSQIAHGTRDVRRPKAASVKDTHRCPV
ncbi:MAG: MoaD family protein [Lachnospiraceae bacterium]|nr:MoaD family protein [Lachnospiraceae bacterium]